LRERSLKLAYNGALVLQDLLRTPAADRSVVHHHAAHAAVLHHRAHALATSLNHLATGFVAAGADHGATVLGYVALAHAHRQIADANHHAVHYQAASAHAACQHRAEVLNHAARQLIVAAAHHPNMAEGYNHDEASFLGANGRVVWSAPVGGATTCVRFRSLPCDFT
jgi:hypothetical protein